MSPLLMCRELKFDKQQDEGDQHWLFTLAKAIKSVKECTYRVADARVLQGLGGFGGAMVKVRGGGVQCVVRA